MTALVNASTSYASTAARISCTAFVVRSRNATQRKKKKKNEKKRKQKTYAEEFAFAGRREGDVQVVVFVEGARCADCVAERQVTQSSSEEVVLHAPLQQIVVDRLCRHFLVNRNRLLKLVHLRRKLSDLSLTISRNEPQTQQSVKRQKNITFLLSTFNRQPLVCDVESSPSNISAACGNFSSLSDNKLRNTKDKRKQTHLLIRSDGALEIILLLE
jgi:hypothetical protein